MYNPPPPPPRPTPISGVVSLVCGLLSLFMLFLGPLAWYLGNKGVAAAKAGVISPAEGNLAMVGKICGIIGTVLLTATLLIWGCMAVLFILHDATKKNQPAAVSLSNTITYTNALLDAVDAQDLKTVEAALAADPKLLESHDIVGQTPLFHAAARPDTSILKFLISKGADVNAQDDFGNTPLDKALSFHRAEAAAILKQHGGRHKHDV